MTVSPGATKPRSSGSTAAATMPGGSACAPRQSATGSIPGTPCSRRQADHAIPAAGAAAGDEDPPALPPAAGGCARRRPRTARPCAACVRRRSRGRRGRPRPRRPRSRRRASHSTVGRPPEPTRPFVRIEEQRLRRDRMIGRVRDRCGTRVGARVEEVRDGLEAVVACFRRARWSSTTGPSGT